MAFDVPKEKSSGSFERKSLEGEIPPRQTQETTVNGGGSRFTLQVFTVETGEDACCPARRRADERDGGMTKRGRSPALATEGRRYVVNNWLAF